MRRLGGKSWCGTGGWAGLGWAGRSLERGLLGKGDNNKAARGERVRVRTSEGDQGPRTQGGGNGQAYLPRHHPQNQTRPGQAHHHLDVCNKVPYLTLLHWSFYQYCVLCLSVCACTCVPVSCNVVGWLAGGMVQQLLRGTSVPLSPLSLPLARQNSTGSCVGLDEGP